MQMNNSILKNNMNTQVSYPEFFEALGYRPEDRIYLRHFSDRSSENSAVNLEVELRRFDAIVPTLKRANDNYRGIFYVVNGGGHKDSDVKAARALFADFDDFSFEEQIEILNGFPLPPSIIIKTRKSLHCYWLLQPYNHDLKKWQMIQERLINHLHSDPVIKNPSRVMRLYGFLHQKKDPVMVTLIKFDPVLKYTLDDFDKALPALPSASGPVNGYSTQAISTSDGGNLRMMLRDESFEWFEKWAREHRIETTGISSAADTLIIGVNCPWRDEHSADTGRKQSAVIIGPDGKLSYKCQHAHCSHRRWRDFRSFYDEAYAEGLKTDAVMQKEQATPSADLDRFHRLDKHGNATGVYDAAIMEDILARVPLFVMGGVPFIYKDGYYQRDDGGTKLRALIRARIYPEHQRAPTEKRVEDLIVHTDSIQTDAEGVNRYPRYWICFKNGMFDPKTWTMHPHNPKYRVVNQIPHTFNPGIKPHGPTIESWLQFIVPETDDRQMLLEYCGYCMTILTTLQIMLVLLGLPGSGKSTLIKLLEQMIGTVNTSHVSLKELSQRFAAYGLKDKLLNTCADLEISALEDVSLIKKALGEDALRVEAKGKDAIAIRNYAKFIFSTNELPMVLNERTNGFYRRLRVLRMDRVPENMDPDFFDKLEAEIDYFIYICMEALKAMLERGKITESVSSKAAVSELRKDSDTVEAWLTDWCWLVDGEKEERGELYRSYQRYCAEMDRAALGKTGFFRALRAKGYADAKVTGIWKFTGIKPVGPRR